MRRYYPLAPAALVALAPSTPVLADFPASVAPEPPPLVWVAPGLRETLDAADLLPGGAARVEIVDRDGIVVEALGAGVIAVGLPEGARGVYLPRLRLAGRELVLPLVAAPKRPVRFRYHAGDEPVESVRLFGTMNSWNRESLPLADAEGDGVWERVVALEGGRYEYKLWVDGDERLDPAAPERVPNGFGGFNSVCVVAPVGLERPPRIRFGSWSVSEPGVARLRITLDRGSDPPSRGARLVALWDSGLLPAAALRSTADGFVVELDDARIPGWRRGRHALRLIFDGTTGPSNLLRLDLDAGMPAGAARPRPRSPGQFRWRDAILYSLVTDRFRNGDAANDAPLTHPELALRANWQGGDLAGVRWAVDSGYFDSLSVDALWISPLQRAATGAYREHPEPHRYYSGYHGYWPIAPRAAEPRFGGMAALRALVDTAHRRGMAVLLDQVTNHVHQEHPYYRDHPDWFGDPALPDGTPNLRRFDEHRLTTWFEPYLPSFDYLGSGAALSAAVEDALWWLRESGADGFRHDATKHVPHRFWRALTGALGRGLERERGRRVFQIGETFGSDALVGSYVTPGQQDAQFDFATYYIVRAALLDHTRSMSEVGRRMETAWRRFGAGHLMGNVIDTHDQVRFASLADADIPAGADDKELGWTDPPRNDHPLTHRRVELFLAWMLTAPGLPVLYYGDEIAMAGAGDPDNRRPMRFGAQLDDRERAHLRATRRWTALRRDHVALRRGDFELLFGDRDLLAFDRTHPLQRVVVLLNRSREARAFDSALLARRPDPRSALDLLSGAVLPLGKGAARIAVGPVSARALAIVDDSRPIRARPATIP